jgi:hypothetical protein
MKTIGIYLLEPVFTYNQFYVVVATLVLKKCDDEDSHSQNGSVGVH